MKKYLFASMFLILSSSSFACWDHTKSDEWNINECQKQAKEGVPIAAMNLGTTYYSGASGAYPSHNKALKFFKQAAAKNWRGKGSALYHIGMIYIDGKHGVLKDTEKAAKWYEKAAIIHENSAVIGLVALYYWDRSARDYNKAYKWTLVAKHRGVEKETVTKYLNLLDDKLSASEKSKAEQLAKAWLEANP